MNHRTAITLLLAVVMSPSCAVLDRKRVATRPPPRVFSPPVAPVRTPLPAPLLDTPPELAANISPEAPIELPTLPVYERPRPQRARRARAEAAPPAKEEQGESKEEPTEPADTSPALQLVEILTPEQRREYDRVIDQNLGQASRSLAASLGRKGLSEEQKDSAKLIEAFIHQAEEARAQDPVRARSLAERASVLAQHLERSLR